MQAFGAANDIWTANIYTKGVTEQTEFADAFGDTFCQELMSCMCDLLGKWVFRSNDLEEVGNTDSAARGRKAAKQAVAAAQDIFSRAVDKDNEFADAFSDTFCGEGLMSASCGLIGRWEFTNPNAPRRDR